MIVLAGIVLRLLADLAGLVVLTLRSRRSVEAENLFLRRQLALYHERGVKPRRIDAATWVSLAVLSQLFDWRDALFVGLSSSYSLPCLTRPSLVAKEAGRVVKVCPYGHTLSHEQQYVIRGDRDYHASSGRYGISVR